MSESAAELLKRIRKEKRITVIELAKRMGVSQVYLAKIELGEIKPEQEQIEVIRSFIYE